MTYICEGCSKRFEKYKTLKRHLKRYKTCKFYIATYIDNTKSYKLIVKYKVL